VRRNLTFPLILVGALYILVCLTYKASHASMTHDESSTFLNLVDIHTLDLWTCFHNPQCWTTANNHLLNTLLMRWSNALFGPKELALRLPNLIFLLIYLSCVALMLRKSATKPAEALFGLAIFTCNPFILDFFALARGYGMGLGFTMLSVYGIWKYLSDNKPRHIVLALTAATLAVFANLTYVAYVAALLVSVTLVIVLPLLRSSWRSIVSMVPVSMAACVLVLVAFFYYPVTILKDLGEFTYGANSFWEAWVGFARDSLYGISWIGNATPEIFAYGSFIVITLCIGCAWLPAMRSRISEHRKFEQFISLLFIGMLLFFICNHLLTGASYPSGRKSIIFYVPASLLVFQVLQRLLSPTRWGQIAMALLGTALFLHVFRTFQPDSFREWWYDSSTKEMALYVAKQAAPGDTATLGVEWIFHPSTQFYVQTRNLPVHLSPYSKDIHADDPVEYYYISPEFLPVLESNFSEKRRFGYRLLLKHKADRPLQTR